MMIAYLTALTFVLSLVATRALANAAAPKPVPLRLHTFVVDPLTFLLIGLVSTMVSLWTPKGKKLEYASFARRKRVLDVLLGLFLVGFWTLEALSYFNVMGHPFNPAKTGNDFMWNGYLDFFMGPIVDTSSPTYESWSMNLLALGLLLLQWAALWFGRQLGYMTAYFNDLNRWTRPKPK